ncbi:MAG: ribosomal protein S18-alanine N-acetyltransferase [Magnetococcales bacterium]|nr:ribosomal protein S18-alanine N-acetyltransferase [Magnetococcales bacterium]
MRVSLLNMEEKHLERVSALDFKLAQRPWSVSMFKEELRLRSFCRLLMNEYGVVVGYGISRLQVDEWHLLTVGVAREFQRQGYGFQLVADVIRKAALGYNRSVLLEVRASNVSALTLYKKMGFETLYIREGYYKAPPLAEDAVVMSRRVQENDRKIFL